CHRQRYLAAIPGQLCLSGCIFGDTHVEERGSPWVPLHQTANAALDDTDFQFPGLGAAAALLKLLQPLLNPLGKSFPHGALLLRAVRTATQHAWRALALFIDLRRT